MENDMRRRLDGAFRRVFEDFVGLKPNAVSSGLLDVEHADHAISACQALIDSTGSWLVDYKQRRNQLVPFNQLATELFLEIIQHTLDDRDDFEAYYKVLLSLRLVSSRWWRTIDGTRKLWTFIPLSFNREIVQGIFRMSYPLPLCMRFRELEGNVVHYKDEKRFARLVAKHSWRWRSLSVGLRNGKSLYRLLAYPSPNLRVLKIHAKSWQPHVAFPVYNVWPDLEELHVRRYSIDWTPQAFASVSKLRQLTFEHIYPTTRFSIGVLMTIIETCQATLEMIALADCKIQPTADAPTGPINLPNLHTLSLIDIPTEGALHLLDSATFPSCGTMDIHFHDLTSTDPHIDSIAARVGRMPSVTQVMASRTPLLEFDWNDRAPFCDNFTAGGLRFEVGGNLLTKVGRREIRGKFCSNLDMALFTHLELVGEDDVLGEALLSLEPRLSHITHLSLAGDPQDPTFEVLGTGDPWLYPQLKHLTLPPDAAYTRLEDLIYRRWSGQGRGVANQVAPLLTLGVYNDPTRTSPARDAAFTEKMAELVPDMQILF